MYCFACNAEHNPDTCRWVCRTCGSRMSGALGHGAPCFGHNEDGSPVLANTPEAVEGLRRRMVGDLLEKGYEETVASEAIDAVAEALNRPGGVRELLSRPKSTH